MAKINVSVWHQANGQILAVGRAMGKHKAVPVAGPHQFVLETEIEETHIKELGGTHRVDMDKKALVKHSKG